MWLINQNIIQLYYYVLYCYKYYARLPSWISSSEDIMKLDWEEFNQEVVEGVLLNSIVSMKHNI